MDASFSVVTIDVSKPFVDRGMIEAYARVVDATLQQVLDGGPPCSAPPRPCWRPSATSPGR
jgi:hypothetical protein